MPLAFNGFPANADTQATYEESQFTWSPTTGTSIVNDASASGGKAIRLQNNTTGGTIADTTPRITNVKVRAKADACQGAPNMRVTLNGTVIANQTVSNSTWTEYNYPVDVPAGSNQLQIGFTNELWAWWFFSVTCVRTLYVDNAVVTFSDAVPSTTTTPPTTTTTTPPPPSGSIPAGSEYVAMGDSYSSGWGADRTATGVDSTASAYDNCGRNNKSAQVLLAAEWPLTLINASCGGTGTDHLLTTSYQGEPPQLNRLTTNTRLATMTIGGNDAGLMWMLSVCVQGGNCWRGSDFWVDSYIAQMDQKIAALGPKMENVLRTAAQRSPNAKIRPAGYPYILSIPGEPLGTCSSWLVAKEQDFFADAIRRTNDAIRRAAEVVAAETGKDIRYVDPLAVGSPFMQRVNGQMLDGCSTSPQRYMNGVNDNAGQAIWHPNILGQQHYHSLYRASVQ